MTTLFTLTFQGRVKASGPLAPEEERAVARSAFPLTPPRDAAVREGFRAYKIAPVDGGRMLLTAVANRGDRDDYERPVLRATGCLLEVAELSGAHRDPTAVWEALADVDFDAGAEAFERRVAALSIHSAAEAFALFRAELARAGDFYARLAGALTEEPVDLYLGAPERARDRLRPALGLLPLSRLRRLHLALGGEPGEPREPILGLAESVPEAARKSRGLLARLLGRRKEGEPVAVDFDGEEIFGSRAAGPRALAAAVADPRPWPGGLTETERYRVLLECLDASDAEGQARTPFDLVPELAELRRAIQRIEALAKELARGKAFHGKAHRGPAQHG